jgi:glycosyltransferase involved in cell wall biosynthesis
MKLLPRQHREKILFLGTDGFPFEVSANIQKQKLISKSLSNAGYDVTIVCRRGTSAYLKNEKRPFKGQIDGINYFYTSFSSRRPCKFLVRNLLKVVGVVYEFIFILATPANYFIINSRSFIRIAAYTLLSKIKHCKTVLTFVEDNDFVPPKKTILRKLNNKLFNKYVWRMVDGAFPISWHLNAKIDRSNNKLPTLLVPILVDIRAFDDSLERLSIGCESYFLYCGSAGYKDVIRFIIDGFSKAKVTSNLLLIVSGSSAEVHSIKKYIKDKQLEKRVAFKQNVSDKELRYLYKNAKALLIPMRENVRDIARFPHKLGEYCASKRPFVTNNWGEISHYFKHNENCFMMAKYDCKDLAGAMEILENDENLCKRIGIGGYFLARNDFDYTIYSNKFKMFLRSIQ